MEQPEDQLSGVQGVDAAERSAVVLGSGLAGIWIARVLADHFDRVTIVERDRLPAAPEHRPGVPQDRQYHILLRRGLQIMDELFPRARPALLQAGAVELDQINDVKTKFRGAWLSRYPSGEILLGCSRILLETTLRQRLQDHPQVHIRDGVQVTGLVAAENQGRVTGVRIQQRDGPARGTEETVHADFVVDATGRRSPAPQWLAALGYAQPEETVIDPHLGYVSRYYRQPAQRSSEWQMMYILPDPPDGTRGGLIFPQEDDAWVVMMAGTNKDYPPTDEAGFDAFARSLDPQFAQIIETAEPISPIYGYRRTANRWRHYEALSRWPDGFIVVGDAFCGFNPVYGQGMTVAAMTAVALAAAVEKEGKRLRPGFAAAFQKRVAKVTKPVWLLATGADLSYPESEGGGEQATLADRFAYWYTDKVMDTVPDDERVRRLFLDVNHLLRPATDLMRPIILWRVLRHSWRTNGSGRA